MKSSVVDNRNCMTKEIMIKGTAYSRRQLTELFWLEYPRYCAKLLIKSPVNDRQAIETLEGILNFDLFKTEYNQYTL